MKSKKLQKHKADQMTPLERRQAVREGRDYDRIPCVPFMGEFKCNLTGTSVWDFWHDPQKMADTEIAAFNRYGYDRIVIGPNTRGITEAMGGKFIYPEKGVPYADTPLVQDYAGLDDMESIDAKKDERILTFAREAELLAEEAGDIVPLEMSIGGPFTIASNLRGTELLLRDCRKYPEEIHRLMRLITESEKSCIDAAAEESGGVWIRDRYGRSGGKPCLDRTEDVREIRVSLYKGAYGLCP